MFGEAVERALKCMRNEKLVYKDYIPPEAIDIGYRLYENTKDIWNDVREKVCKLLLDELPYEYAYPTIWWYSVVCAIYHDPMTYHNFIKYVRDNQDKFSSNTLFFLYYQFKFMSFVSSDLDGADGRRELWLLYNDIIDKYKNKISVSLERIPVSERDDNLIVVITEQFILTKHGPTKTALDRCKAIITNMNKRVLLINTAEILSNVGEIPFCCAQSGSYMPEKMSEKYQDWKGVQVPYIQCRRNMPDISSINDLLSMIRELAPARIVSIGGSSVVANLADKIIPAITVGLGPSDLEYTTTSFQTLSRKVNDNDRKLLSAIGLSESHVIESVFTSSLKPQTEKITKADLGIPEDSFLIIVVGARLDMEVTDEFLDMLEATVEGNMILGFLGKFDEFDSKISRYDHLRNCSRFFGFCSDILSRMEICDLYINPHRKGGGTSCVEAMFKGVPVVTCGYGDVSVNVGDAFWVEDYSEMKDKILQYYNDKEYYSLMSKKAKKRAELLLDTEGEFIKILDEVDKREALM